MIQVRENCFETNSSSVHTLCMCMKSEYDKWAEDWNHLEEDSLIYYRWNEDFVTVKEAVKNHNKSYGLIDIEDVLNPNAEDHEDAVELLKEDYWTVEDYENEEYEKYYTEYTTPNGEKVVAFGVYGNDY